MLCFQALGMVHNLKICWNNCVKWRVSSVPPYLSDNIRLNRCGLFSYKHNGMVSVVKPTSYLNV